MTWTQGRRLASITQNGITTSYEYNVNGIRTKKTVGEEVYNMLLSDDTLIGVEYEDVYTLIFLRDDGDRIIGFRQYSTSGTLLETYYYEFNVQGDVVALYNSSKEIVGKYAYDSWGKFLSVTNASGSAITAGGNVAIVNPIRYRGYYYDNETGFYYLNSRYYDPAIRRFINGDAYLSTGQGLLGFNMYAYCGNNPVIYSDPFGFYAGKCMNGFVVPGSSGYWVNYGYDSSYKSISTRGQYYEFDRNDLYYEGHKIITLDTEYDVQNTYADMQKKDLQETKSLVETFLPFLNFFDGIAFLLDLLQLGEGVNELLNQDATTIDPEGRPLYLEIGYQVVKIDRVYIGRRYSATDVEYKVYDRERNLIYNNSRIVSYTHD